ncbi:MAG: M56 family metallopeptidase [Candidatus Sumerlaeia bacterium]
MESLFRLDASDPWARALAILIDSGAKGIVLLSVAALAVALMRKSSAAARHLVWALSLCGLLLLPLLSLVVPKWQLPILPRSEVSAVQPAAAVTQVAPAPAVSQPLQPAVMENQPNIAPAPAPAPAPLPRALNISPIPVAVVVWALAALFVVMPLAVGFVAIGRLVRSCNRLEGPDWTASVASLSGCIGLRRTVRLLGASPQTMPMTTGFLRPVIILPETADDWSDDKRRSVLLHELAHVKRRDCLTHTVARVAVSLHWFNPLAWAALRRMRIERERACDDLVLTAGERPSDYADHLLTIARTLRAGSLASAAAITMAKRSQIEGRLLAVLDPTRNRRALKWRTCAIGVFVLLGLALPLGVIQLSAREDAQAKYRLEFSRGARAAILGVAEQGTAPNRPAWLADGTPLDFVPEGFQNGVSVSPGGGQVARIFYLEITAPNKPTDIECRVDGHGGATATSCENGRIRIEMAAAVPARDKKAAVEIGVADGPWVKLIEGAPGNATSTSVNNMNLNVSVMFSDVLSDKGRPCVIVSHDVKDRDWRVVAFDDKGASHIAQNPESTGFAGMNQSKTVFPDLASTATIKRLELQAREYEWRKIEDVALRPDPRLAAGRLPRPTIQAHRFYPVGTGPVIMLSTATSENVVKLKDGRPLLFFKMNGTEEPLTIGMSPFSAFGRMTHHLSIPGDVRDGKPLSPGHYKVSVVFRDFKVYPKDGGEPRTIDSLETNAVEFDVVDKLPDNYIEAVYQDGWDKLLRDRTEYIFNDERSSFDSKNAPMLLGVKVVKRLPFALAFDVYAECEGDPERQLVGTLNTTGEIGIWANFAAKGLTWQNAPQKKWRLSFKPSAKVALLNPPIREYYGREVVGDWVSFTPSPGYKTQLGMAVAPQLRIVNSWPVGTKMPRVGWQPDGAPIKDEPTARVFETYPLMGAANNDRTPNRTFVEVMVHHPLFDDHSEFTAILYDVDNNQIAAPVSFANNASETHKRFPGWRDMLKRVEANQLPAVGKVELRCTFGTWTGVCEDFTPFDGEKEISSDVTIQSIKPLGKDKTEVRYITTNRSLGETYQYSAAAVTSLEFARGGLVETRDQNMKSRGNGYLYTARLDVPFKEIKRLRIRCRPVQRFTFENVAFAPKKTEPKKADEKALELHGRAGDLPLIRLDESSPAVTATGNRTTTSVLALRWVATNQERDKAEKLPPYRGALSKDEVPSFWVQNEAQLSERDFASAEVVPNSAGKDYVISLKLTAEGQKRFAELTGKNIGRQMAIVVNGRIVSAPIVNEAITGGGVQISGGFSRKQAEEIVAAMKQSNPALASGPAGTGFGPVHERVLNHTGENCLIDFDKDRLLSTPRFDGDTKAAFDWIAANGVDAGCGDESTGLIGMELIVQPMPNSFWETASAESLSKSPVFEFGKPGDPVYLSARGELPVTYAFKTREGGVGIVQILEYVGPRPSGVKIRYKMAK